MKEQQQAKAKALALQNEAEKKLQSGCGGQSRDKVEEAAELLVQAGNTLKAKQLYKEAVDCFVKAASLYSDLEENFQAARLHKEIALNYKREGDTFNFCFYADLAISAWSTNGNFSSAANLQQQVAEYLETVDVDVEQTLTAWSKTRDLGIAADLESLPKNCQMKIADISALKGEYIKASDLYLEIANLESRGSSIIGKYKIEELCRKSCLCNLALGDIVGAKRAIERCNQLAVSLKLDVLADILNACEESDIEAFDKYSEKFSFLYTGKFYRHILDKIKERLEQDDDDGVL